MATRTLDPHATISGHVWLYEGKRRNTWCAKWRDHRGQHEKRLGPAWTGKGSPAPGFLRERDAQELLDAILVDARRGQLQHERTGLTFAYVAEEWFERGRFERDWSASTQADYRSVLDAHLLPKFGSERIETIGAEEIERWRNLLAQDDTRSRRTVNKIVTQLHTILQHAVDHHALIANPAAKVKRLRETYAAARFDFYSTEEINKLVATATAGAHRDPTRPAISETERALRAAEDRQDAAIYLTAALSGLRRSELLALRWEDVDFEQSSIRVFEGYSAKRAGKPKSRKSRTVPMVEGIGGALGDLKTRGRTPPRMTWCSSAARAPTLTAPLCAGATWPRLRPPACGSCDSTTSAILSVRLRSTSPASFRYRRGLGTPTSRPRCATCTTRAALMTPNCWPRRLGPRPRHHRPQVTRLEAFSRLTMLAF